MPRHSVAIHCQWSAGAYASAMGTEVAKASDSVRLKPVLTSATGILVAASVEMVLGLPGGEEAWRLLVTYRTISAARVCHLRISSRYCPKAVTGGPGLDPPDAVPAD